jgi:spore maturation protein CgeB
MRVLIISTDYGPFLRSLYNSSQSLLGRLFGRKSELYRATYAEQLDARNNTLFGCSDFYSRNFIAQGHEAAEFHVNNGVLQSAWLRDRGQQVGERPAIASPLRSPIEPSNIDLEEIIIQQAREMRPDVVLNQAVSEVQSRVLERIRPYCQLIVGQIASPYPEDEPYTAYDLMISSLPNFVNYYRKRGIRAELNLLGFEPRVLQEVRVEERDVPLSFVGSITSDHGTRYQLIDQLARETDIKIWGRLVSMPPLSPVMKRYQGEAWGHDMFRVLARSKITINQHIDIAENYANNMRLFEATGMGALLITDWKDNLGELFVLGKEVVCYRSVDECLELIEYYSRHEDERAAIAAAGQRRTLQDHSYAQVVEHQVRIFERGLATKGGTAATI